MRLGHAVIGHVCMGCVVVRRMVYSGLFSHPVLVA